MAVCLLFQACSPQRDPVYSAPGLAAFSSDTLAVAPIFDARENVFDDVQVVGQARRTVENALSEKGYAVVPAKFSRGDRKYTAGDIAKMSEKELAAAAPGDVRYLVLVSLDRVERGVGELGKTIGVKLSGRLVDLQDERELWRDTAEGDADLGGLLTVLTGPAPDYEASYDAARALFATFPDGPKRGRGAAPAEQSAPAPAPVEGMRPVQER